MLLILSDHLRAALPNHHTFDFVMRLRGRVFREHGHRRTMRCEIGGRAYFVKVHGHIGWREIVKSLVKSPALTALPEWRAIARLRELGVPTMVAEGIGVRGWNPARRESFLITRELEGMIHLDEAAELWKSLPRAARLRVTRQAIVELAAMARTLHRHGMNHRDFYLCHFLLPQRDFSLAKRGEALSLHVIDLHRVQVRRKTPARWVIKDLAGLLFSSLDSELSEIDILRFVREYEGSAWRDSLRRRRFWRSVIRRAVRTYSAHHGRAPALPAGLASF